MAIVKTDVPQTSELCNNTILELVKTYPFLRTELLTETAFGRKIRTLVIGKGKRKVIYSAAHHANEWITTPILLKFAEELAETIENGGEIFGIDAKMLAETVTIYLVPMVNPDGVDLVTGAIKPGEGQYETARALAGYTEYINPDLILAYHAQGKEIYWQFDDIEVPGAEELGRRLAEVSGYTLTAPAEVSSYAGYKDWFIKSFRKPGYTIEVGSGENPLPLEQFDEIYRANLGILVTAALGLPGGA